MPLGHVERKKEGEKVSTRHYSSKQEKATAKNLNGSKTINSGATPFEKGDVIVDNLMLIECKTKTSTSNSMSIKKDWLEKNAREALFMGKPYNALAFNFGPNQPNYYILDEKLFEEFLEYIRTKGK